MLFTVFNAAALESGMGEFKFQTEGDEIELLDRQIDQLRREGRL